MNLKVKKISKPDKSNKKKSLESVNFRKVTNNKIFDEEPLVLEEEPLVLKDCTCFK